MWGIVDRYSISVGRFIDGVGTVVGRNINRSGSAAGQFVHGDSVVAGRIKDQRSQGLRCLVGIAG